MIKASGLQQTSVSPASGRGSAGAELPPKSLAARRANERRHELGIYAYHRGDYALALASFEKVCAKAAETRDYATYVDSCTYYLRILAEREEFTKIDRIEAHVLGMLASAETVQLPPRLKSRALYILGICNCYQETRHETAMRRFREAIDCAMAESDKEALAAPLYGSATVQYASGKYEATLRELDRLGVLLTCLNLPDLRSASWLLRAMVRRNQGLLDEALESAWKAFDSLKHHPHLVLYLHSLCVLGTIFQKKGDLASARLYLDLANRSLKRAEFPRIARLVDESMTAVGVAAGAEADLIFDSRTGLLTEKIKGEIRFEGQFILRDLLRVFLQQPGKVFTKEDLARKVWRETYNPDVHDNKIYVTIKRLRALLDSKTPQTEYILRAKTGYFLNPKTRVLINEVQIVPEHQNEPGTPMKMSAPVK